MSAPHLPDLDRLPPNSDGDGAAPRHKGIIAWWADNSVAANVLMVLAIVGGIVGYFQLDRLTFPSAALNFVSVEVVWPGAAPAEIEEQIILRLEDTVSDMEEIAEITSIAREGSAVITLEALRTADMNAFVDDVKLRVDSVNNLPRDSERPIVRQLTSDQWYMGMALHGDVPPVELKRIGREIRNEIAREIPGASRAVTEATLPEEVAIEVSQDALRAYGLTFDEVAQAVRGSSVNVSGGFVRLETGSISVSTRNQAETAEDFASIILRQTPDGAIIRVGDVAAVSDGLINADFNATFNGQPMVIVALRTLESGMNVVETQRALKAYIEAKQAELPAGVTLSLWWDDSESYFARMKTVLNSAGIGLVLVLLTLMLFLRPVVAFWVSVGIATAFLGAFSLLPAMGVSLNMLSLFAFLLVIGIVVDDAIIVGENVHNQVERGRRGLDASVIGTQLVAKPVVFAVLTTMMAFSPFMLLSGPEVQFTKQISLVVIAALTFSLIESLLILPNHLSHLKPQSTDGPFGGLVRFQQRFANALITFARKVYRPAVILAIHARYATVAAFVGLFIIVITLLANGYLRTTFLPDVEQDFIFVSIEMPDGTPYSRVEQIKNQLERAEAAFMEDMNARFPDQPVVAAVSAFAFDTSVQAWISLVPAEDRPRGVTVAEMSENLQRELGMIPDAREVSFTSTFNNTLPRVVVSLRADDLDALNAAAGDVKAHLATYDTVIDVRDTNTSAADEARLTLLPGAQALGLTEGEVTRQLAQAFYGEEIQRLPRDGEDVGVWVRLPEVERESLESLEAFQIRLSDGREVPLLAVAEVRFAEGVSTIRRIDRQREVQVIADVPVGEADDIYKDLEANFYEAFFLRHPDVTSEEVGERQDQEQFNQELGYLFGAVLVGMYVLLAFGLRAVFQPLLILTSIPFCLTGAIIGNIIVNSVFGMNIAFGMFTTFGVIAAGGVVINDNLVFIDYVNRLRRQGYDAFTALVEGGVQRFRPILLTSVTTFVGVLPMLLEQSTQAKFLQPMVVALAFAIVFALFVTLLFVPALYAVGSDVWRYFAWLWSGKPFTQIGHYDRLAKTPPQPMAPTGGQLPKPNPAPGE